MRETEVDELEFEESRACDGSRSKKCQTLFEALAEHENAEAESNQTLRLLFRSLRYTQVNPCLIFDERW